MAKPNYGNNQYPFNEYGNIDPSKDNPWLNNGNSHSRTNPTLQSSVVDQ